MSHELRKPLLVSLGMHMLLFAFMAWNGFGGGGGSGKSDTDGEGGTGRQQQEENIIPKSGDNESVDVELIEAPSEVSKPKTPHAEDECEHFFGGIGIETRSDIVVRIYDGYPAASSGLELHDHIADPPIDKIRGEVGTAVKLTVIKLDGSVAFITLVRDKICYN